MILKCDAAQLEWRVKVWLAQDKVAMDEILNNLDLHTDNQAVFGLPSRLIAKIFIYRMIFADAFGPQGYDSPAYAYSNDNDFMPTSKSKKFWVSVIEKFFNKYPQVREHSVDLIREACQEGKIVNPSGRFYEFVPYNKWNGELDWPRTKILNYPVQGCAADFMTCARLAIAHRYWNIWKPKYGGKVLLINTVHDDVEMDVDNDPEIVYNISLGLIDCFRGIPKQFESKYGVHVNVPMDGEVKYGFTLSESSMTKFKENSFEEDFKNAISSRNN